MTAAFVVPALVALYSIRAEDEAEGETHCALLHPRERRQRAIRPLEIFREPALHTFAICAVLFHLANAAMLPLALNELAKHTPSAGLVVPAAIIVPQVIVATMSPWVGSEGADAGPATGAAGRLRRTPRAWRTVRIAGLGRPGGAAAGRDPTAGRRQRDGVRPHAAADRRRCHTAHRLFQFGDRFARAGNRPGRDGQHDTGRRGGGCGPARPWHSSASRRWERWRG